MCWNKLHVTHLKSPLLAASRIRYEITNGNIGGAFAVKNMTGAIYVAGPLDYETRKRVSKGLDKECQILYNAVPLAYKVIYLKDK